GHPHPRSRPPPPAALVCPAAPAHRLHAAPSVPTSHTVPALADSLPVLGQHLEARPAAGPPEAHRDTDLLGKRVSQEYHGAVFRHEKTRSP
ncbi:hypothetical protein, partial [Rothia nasisuis]|uniref:hypothetical protein n=1 Tax=Rothia nasisuis TaxID=2109647 RepID=UPI001F1E1CA6